MPDEPALLCPECSAPVEHLEAHLRQAHKIYELRGARRSYDATVAVLLSSLLSSRHDPEAWDVLASLAREDHGDRAERFLASLLGGALGRLPQERRASAAESLGQVIAGAGAVQLIAVLAADAESLCRQVALCALASLPPPLLPFLVAPLRGLLLDRRLPSEQQLAAAAVLMRAAVPDSPLAAEVLETLITGLPKPRAIERLRQLQQLTGATPAIEALCDQIEEKARMTCPRCGAQHRKPDMVQHLWQNHRLVLDGRRVRDPWGVVEEWIDAYKARKDPALLERCHTAASRIDPDRGPSRLRRLLLARGINDPQARQALLEEAQRTQVSLCPYCFADVPLPPQAPPYQVNVYRGRISARGYRVELSDPALRSHLEIETPSGVVLSGTEPGRHWSARAIASLLAAPLVVLALILSVGPMRDYAPLVPVLLLLALAFAAWRLGRWLGTPSAPIEARARAFTWSILVPRLHEGGFRLEDSCFLAGLAELSRGRRGAAQRATLLPRLVQMTTKAVTESLAPPSHLARIYRLQIEDAAYSGSDPVPLVAQALGRCLDGRLPMEFASALVEGWDSDWWTRGSEARLRVLFCERAFAEGFEVRDLLELARRVPLLGRVLASSRPEALAGLRLVWAWRDERPWRRCGKCLTAFEVAAGPQYGRSLGRQPDLLLLQEEPTWPLLGHREDEPEPVRIALSPRGLLLQEVLFTADPLLIDQINRPGGTEITMGDHRFRARGRLPDLAPRLKEWFRYAFDDFLRRLRQPLDWEASDRMAIPRALGAKPCPSCERHLLPQAGAFGAALDKETTNAASAAS